jgi:CDP-glucose 4,6-dehydratase
VPQLCAQLINRESDVLELKRSTGRSVFEFLFVDDSVSALIKAAENNAEGVSTFQFSAGLRGRSSVLDLAHRISEMFDGRRRKVLINTDKPEKQVEKYLDTRKTEQTLQWKAGWGLNEGLRTTIDWYKIYANSLTPHSDL